MAQTFTSIDRRRDGWSPPAPQEALRELAEAAAAACDGAVGFVAWPERGLLVANTGELAEAEWREAIPLLLERIAAQAGPAAVAGTEDVAVADLPDAGTFRRVAAAMLPAGEYDPLGLVGVFDFRCRHAVAVRALASLRELACRQFALQRDLGRRNDPSARGDAPARGDDAPRLAAIVRPSAEATRQADAMRLERRFAEALVESMPGILYLHDARGRFLRWNRHFEQVTGYGTLDIARMHPRAFFPPAQRMSLEANIAEVLAFGTSSFEAPLSTQDGREIPYFFTGKRIEFDGQRCVVCIGIDVAERVHAEREQETSERRFRTLFDYAPDGILVSDPHGAYLEANESACRMLGYERHEIVGLRAGDIVAPVEREQVAPTIDAIRGHVAHHREWSLRRKDGTIFPAEVIATLMPDGNLLGMLRDVTERRRAEEELRRSEDRFRAIFEQAGVGITLVDAHDGRFVRCNRALAEMLGYDLDALRRLTVADVSHPADLEVQDELSQRLLAGAIDRYRMEKRYRRGDGSEMWALLTATLVRHADGRPQFIVGMLEDITERRALHTALEESEKRFRQITEHIPAVFFLADARSGECLYVSPAYERIWGRSCESVYRAPNSWLDAIVPGDPNPMLRDGRPIDTGAQQDFEYRIARPDGSIRWIHSRSFPVFGTDGSLQQVAGIAEDITEAKEQEARIARLTRIRAVVGALHSAMLRQPDRESLLQEACRVAAVEGIFEIAWIAGPCPGAGLPVILAVADEGSRGFIEANLRALGGDHFAVRALATRRPVVINDCASDPTLEPVRSRLVAHGCRSAAAFPLSCHGDVVAALVLLARERDFFDDGELGLLGWITSDLSYALENIANAQRLQHLAYFDALTGLANAALFRDRLGQFVASAATTHGKVCAVILDLEHFTHLNESLGRESGDEILRAVAQRLEQRLVEPYALGRIGADTFAIARPGSGDRVATQLLEQVIDALREPFHVAGQSISISGQAGIGLYPDDAGDDDSLFKHAEAALKLAKSSGARQMFYSAQISQRIATRLDAEAALQAAVEAGQFVLHYQPRVDMVSGLVVGAEALIRWEHPQRGLVPPEEFIALAEETGLIVPIGAWVIDAICAQQAAWLEAGAGMVPIAANISSVQFDRSDVVRTVRDALARHSLFARHLHLELTESSVMKDPDAAAEVLRGLRELGVGLALDDFGTGHSSLAYLKRFPFTRVKIDRTFISDITHSAEDAAIASAIIAIAHRMGLKVVAEGVETQGQFNYLSMQGCDEMQGYYFSPAVSADMFEDYLRGGRSIRLLPRADEERRTVLVVDDEPGIRTALTRMLRSDGYRVLTAASGDEGLHVLSLNAVQVIISDQRMPGMSGTEFLGKVKDLYPETMRIILSGYTEIDVVTESVNRGAVFRFLTKPWDDDLLREQVRDAFQRYRPRPGVEGRSS
ncbi:PAS domain S-box protein [Dokdonella fugitiva]|uniref:cyclic-guanylate-specific phosphodiesterase n=1 Tax=Dokdonella fugitiva TaxID=328517 RepID=A0A4R2I0P0_9GAMM|nr:PAS domain S-box protein [Dokdonella fugitiva]TCO37196.1 PAS domain S-box-containing protein/diguanylate cyclase (GGDEF)-like protein [Dokdonella fugitiva]